ncbi:hypothetical protein [Parafrankia discariae]|uniref:hypothetical protein n=1 Tax=Parafrankia discariae TaxID=365528 RepID=UPI0003A31F4E|nr:hypothetical protein [Parafrankia discariae]
MSADLERIAGSLQQRNALDAQIAAVIDRPMTAGHLGEWIAARVFGVELEPSATATAIDGRFTSGPLQGRTVNVKLYLKRENLLDVTESPALDYYLVFTGPASTAGSSRGGTRPWSIAAVYLFRRPAGVPRAPSSRRQGGGGGERAGRAVRGGRDLPAGEQRPADGRPGTGATSAPVPGRR